MPSECWQILEDHLKNVADLADNFTRVFGAGGWGRIAGLLHDIGKFRPEFQDKLIANSSKRVDHKSVGAKIAYETLGDPGKLISYCIAGHHGGLPNFGYPAKDGSASLEELLDRAPPLPPSALTLFNDFITPPLPFILDTENIPNAFFQLSFFTRLVFSALVDADFIDTEQFMNPDKADVRKHGLSLNKLLPSLNERLDKFAPDSTINELRCRILEHCRMKAKQSPGFFSLTVPTGGGKTLSSMAFAIDHAMHYGLRRIIYVIPYTSIIEQNARVFREIFPSGSVIEHHSNFDDQALVQPEEKDQSGAGLKHRLACENWDSPVVVTTNVQFFESLYAAKPSRCRKLHNLARSVIILDEAQMLPIEYLAPCLRALEGLVKIGQSSVVLCTATQPALEKRDQFAPGIENIREIAPDPASLHKSFHRTIMVDLGTLNIKDVAVCIRDKPQVLCIVNTRARAGELFAQIKNEPGARHLSALMCPAHRTLAISGIRKMLEKKEPCRVVSTQLIEAGVDISFPEVIREMAGLDAIAQASGRCNREGKMDQLGRVSIFNPEEGLPPVFAQAAGNTRSTLRHYGKEPFSPEAMEYFFSETYWLRKEFLDRKYILDEFNNSLPKWSFRDIADRFRLIEKDMLPVIIPYDDAAYRHIERLRYAQYRGGILRQLQQYTVQVYRHQFSALDTAGAIEFVEGAYAVLIDRDLYNERLGLCIPDGLNGASDFIF